MGRKDLTLGLRWSWVNVAGSCNRAGQGWQGAGITSVFSVLSEGPWMKALHGLREEEKW